MIGSRDEFLNVLSLLCLSLFRSWSIYDSPGVCPFLNLLNASFCIYNGHKSPRLNTTLSDDFSSLSLARKCGQTERAKRLMNA